MKWIAVLSGISTFWLLSIPALGQGSLAPPGAPAATMKSLDQIEARTPISSVPYNINQSGSYYLTQDLYVYSGNGINVNASNVTLDLNGFTIYGYANPAAGSGIAIGYVYNTTIRNGKIISANISGYGFANGILGNQVSPPQAKVTNVWVQGSTTYGIYLDSPYFLSGANSEVESCNVWNSGSGIAANSVRNSSAFNCGSTGIGARIVSDCTAQVNVNGAIAIKADVVSGSYGEATAGNGTGIQCTTVINSYGRGKGTGAGIQASQTASNCYGVNSDSGDGLVASAAATNCYGEANTGRGLFAPSAHNCGGYSATNYGLQAGRAENCYGVSNSNIGLSANTAQSSFGGCNGNGDGIYITDYGTAMNCRATAQGGGTGIFTGNGCTVTNSVSFGSATGIQVASDCLIQGNNLDQNSNGVVVSGTGNRLEGNRATCPAPGQGFIINGTNNLIIRNSARDNGTNQFSIVGSNNSYGTIVNVNFTGGGQLPASVRSDPWANIVY